MKATRIQFAIRLSLAMILFYAAATKTFQQGYRAQTLFAEWSQFSPVRYAIICGEALLALWLVSGIKLSLAGLATLTVLSAFCGLIILDLERKYPAPCGCMGAATVVADPGTIRSSLRFDLFRNIFMMCGAVWLYFNVGLHGLRGAVQRATLTNTLNECSPA